MENIKTDTVLKIKSREYKVEKIQPSGCLLVARIPDGKKFRVPAFLARKLNEEKGRQFGLPDEAPAAKRSTLDIINDLRRVFSRLSPENLSCDGELSRSQIQVRYSQLQAEKNRLVRELGHHPTENELWGQGGDTPAQV